MVLAGDIDRGGVIASLVGTKHVLAPADAALIKGFIVNKMRGDPSLFADGMAAIAEMTGWAALGLVPYFAGASRLPAEDALALRPSGARNPSPCPSPAQARLGELASSKRQYPLADTDGRGDALTTGTPRTPSPRGRGLG